MVVAHLLEFSRALNSLDLCYNNLGGASKTIAQAVLQHPTMEVFCNIPMKKMREDSLTKLDLSRKGIGAHGAMVIAPLLEFSRALKSANLDYNDIGDEGAVAISAALESNTTLEDLSLRADPDVTQITAVGAQAIAKMLVVNRALKSVDLRYNWIPDEGCRQLRAAAGNKSITLQLEPQRL